MSVFARKASLITLGVGFSVACMLLTLSVYPSRTKSPSRPDGLSTSPPRAVDEPLERDVERSEAVQRTARSPKRDASRHARPQHAWAVAWDDLEAGHWRSTTVLSPVWRDTDEASNAPGAEPLNVADGADDLPLADAPLPRETAVPMAQREADEAMDSAVPVASDESSAVLVAAGVDDRALTATVNEALETDRSTRQASFIPADALEGGPPLRRTKGTNITLSRMSPMVNAPREALTGWASVDRVRLALNVGIISGILFAIGAWLFGRARARSPQA